MTSERLSRMINAGSNNREVNAMMMNHAAAVGESAKISADSTAHIILGIVKRLEETTNLRDRADYMKCLADALDQVAYYIDCAKQEAIEAATDLQDAVQYLEKN